MKTTSIIQTEYGPVSGIIKDGCRQYLGIPFAAPPTGELAFRHPVPPRPWEEVYKADQGKANAIQQAGRFSVRYTSQDCLYLNIFVPAEKQGPLPVMVWIHGGSYNTGGTGAKEEGSAELEYDLSRFAKETGTVVVSFNYRMNVYGFLNLHYLNDRFDQNCGLYDQIMALSFIRKNIQVFGGDPQNITVFGQSAGAACILALLCMPEAEDLFDKCIVMSACVDHFFTETESRKYTKLYLKLLGLRETQVMELLTYPEARIVEANKKFCRKILMKMDIRCAFSPIVDGITLGAFPKEGAAKAEYPILIGTTMQEANLYVNPYPKIVLPFITGKLGLKPAASKGTYKERVSAALTEYIYKEPSHRILDSYQGPAWEYEYRHISIYGKETGLGCFHASDVPVLFGKSFFSKHDDEETDRVGKEMRDVWSRFAHFGDPGWEPYAPGCRPEWFE